MVRYIVVVVIVALAPRFALAATSAWWDNAYLYRQNIAVTTGANVPDRGYDGYTLRSVGLDTQTLIASGQMRADCGDLRVAYFSAGSWQELPRHVIDCGTGQTDVRFASPVNIPGNAIDDDFYFYYGNPAAAAPIALTTTNVYLWFDDASIDRSASYIRGRVDNFHGNGWDNTLAFNPAGYYTYRNGDNFTSGYRLAVDERDVFIEAEFFHVDCFPINMTTGVLVRGIIQSGSGGSERSNHYYTSNRGEFPASGCGNANGYGHDGAVMRRQRNQIAVPPPVNPGDITPNVWRRQALAAYGVAPTSLRFWDADDSAAWSALGFPDTGNLLASGSDDSTVNNRGFVAVMTSQDQARLRNVVVRRYVEPEPATVLGPQELQASPDLTVLKNVRSFSDPVNGEMDPFSIPGGIVEYEVRVENGGSGPVDNDSLVITDVLSGTLALVVDDLTPGGGPVSFTDGTGSSVSGLSFAYGGLADLADDVAFSTDGVNFNYVPSPDANGTDPAVSHIRITPSGTMQASGGGTATFFVIRFRMRVP
ncbi:MAG: hypothetical protein AAAFM81_09225 [Pseudomonadota bacterium]